MPFRPKVSIIVVTWNVSSFLEGCLRAITPALGSNAGEIIVVDNASNDGTLGLARTLATKLPNLTILPLEQNYGFAYANNFALQRAMGEYVLLLNPDTELYPSAIATLVACARQHGAAIVGAHHHNADGTTQPSVRRDPTLAAMVWLLLKANHYFPRFPSWLRYLAADFDYGKTQAVEQVAGSCLLISREAVNKIGQLDIRFYLWFEEVDWCTRAQKLGLTVWYCSEALVKHSGAQSFRQLPTVSRQRQFNRSLRRYFRKHRGFLPWLVLTAISPLSLLLATLSRMLRLRAGRE